MTDGSGNLTTTSTQYLPLTGGTMTGNLNGVTPTQLTYLDTLSSNVQTQLNTLSNNPGSHSATIASPSGGVNYWFIPFDPNNSSTPLSSTSIKSVRVELPVFTIQNQASPIWLRFATTSDTGIVTSTYSANGTYTGATTVTSVSNAVNSSSGIPIMTGTNLTVSGSIPDGVLTGFLDINWYLGPTIGAINVTGMVGFTYGTHTYSQSIYGTYEDLIANVSDVVGFSLVATANASACYPGSECTGTVIMNRA